MWKIKVLAIFFVAISTVYATLGSDLEEDGFRSLKEVENDGSSDESENDLNDSEGINNDEEAKDEDLRTFHNEAPDPNTLEHENLDEFEKLRTNPPFPVLNDELEEESDREKREVRKNIFGILDATKKKRKNKMDETIRDIPDAPENSKFNSLYL